MTDYKKRIEAIRLYTNDGKAIENLHPELVEAIEALLHQVEAETDRNSRIDELTYRRKMFEVPEQVLSADGIHKRPAAEGRNKLKADALASIDKRIAELLAHREES